jgi:beta-galactosidase
VESYPDRRSAGLPGVHRLSVAQAFTPYLRPQESGGRNGVHWFAVSGPAGRLVVQCDQPRQVSAIPYRAAELTAAAHHDELVPAAGTVVHLDAAHRGVGTASCGPDTLPQYLLTPGRYQWAWTLAARPPA